MKKNIGILTAGGDSPGLNAAIRAVGKAAIGKYGMNVVGFRDGFRGLMENRFIRLNNDNLSGILTLGGTILGTSRDKPHRMSVGGQQLDMTSAMVENYEKHHLDAIVCLGGGGTQKSALRLANAGLSVVTLPKTIDNDVAMTDVSFGFDTAMSIATEAIDRLHSTAHSHHRIIVVETMGHNTGWLALGSGLAAGADVILIPEVPYDINKVADSVKRRSQGGRGFSIIAVSEGALSSDERDRLDNAKKSIASGKEGSVDTMQTLRNHLSSHTYRLSKTLEEETGLETRMTILGHVQRGGTPSPFDRVLASRLGTAAVQYVADGLDRVMAAAQGEESVPVPLEKVAGIRKIVPQDHIWIKTAKELGLELGYNKD